TTALHADGSVDREIFQPVADTPEAARAKGPWEKMTVADYAAGKSKPTPYLTASGHFGSAEKIPDYLAITASKDKAAANAGRPADPAGRLVRHYRRSDYVFV